MARRGRSGWRSGLGALQQGSVLLACMLILVIWSAAGLTLRSQRQQDLQNGERSLDTLARAYADDAARSLKDVDKTLLLLRRAYEANPASFDLPSFTRSAYFVSDVTLQIAQIGADGMLAATNLGPQATPVFLGDREHFRVHQAGGEDRLFISAPVLGRASGKWSVQMTRRLTDAAGRFAGVLVASVDPDYLARFFASMDDGSGFTGAVTLVGDDGIVRARGSHDGSTALGQSLVDTPLMDALRRRTQGLITAASPFDGQMKLMAHRRLPDFPLSVIVSQPVEAITAGSGRERRVLIAGSAALSLVVLLGMLASIVHAMRLERTRQALASSESRASQKSHELAVALENMSQGIMMVDAEQNVVVINRRCIDLLGLPARFLDSRPAFAEVLDWQWQAGEFGEGGSALSPPVLAFIQGGGVGDALTVYERRRPNGTVLEVRSLPLPGGGIVRTYTDVTQRTEAAAQLAEARDRAETASRARTAFLAMMSHEIRTPLNGVIGMASLLAGTRLDEEQVRYTGTLRDSAEHLLQIIDDVLDFAKLEADRGIREQVSFDLERTVESVLAMVAPRARDKDLLIGAIVDPAIPDLVVGDSGAVRQVLLNLVGNGVKFTAKGSVIVEVTRPDGDDDEQAMMHFSVRDTGIGIAPEDMPSLFREFSQLDDTISRRFGGTGLGLAISKHLVERQGGSITVDSEPGRGSTFHFTMPLRRAEGASRQGAAPALAGQRWVVVAPRSDVQAFDSRLFATAGAQATSVSGPVELAALLARAPSFTGVLVDGGPADPDWREIAACLRGGPSDASLPMIAVMPLGVSPRATAAASIDVVLKAPLTPRALIEGASRLIAGRPRIGAEPDFREADLLLPPPDPARSALRVLVAEDNRTSRMVLQALLERLGHTAVAVVDGRAAVDRIMREPFDLVLMDLMMPDMDGYAAARAIRGLSSPASTTPIVALTADALTADLERVRQAGMDAFATKPITHERLAACIEAARAARPAAPPVAPAAQPGPATPDACAPVIDQGAWDAIADALDAATVSEILAAFIEDTESRIARMAAPGASPAAVAGEAHALKSAAGTFGFTRLQALATMIEAVAGEPGATGFADLVVRLRPLFDEARDAATAPDHRGSADPPPAAAVRFA